MPLYNTTTIINVAVIFITTSEIKKEIIYKLMLIYMWLCKQKVSYTIKTINVWISKRLK